MKLLVSGEDYVGDCMAISTRSCVLVCELKEVIVQTYHLHRIADASMIRLYLAKNDTSWVPAEEISVFQPLKMLSGAELIDAVFKDAPQSDFVHLWFRICPKRKRVELLDSPRSESSSPPPYEN